MCLTMFAFAEGFLLLLVYVETLDGSQLTALPPSVRGERRAVPSECLSKDNCEPAINSYMCSRKIYLNECPRNHTIEVDPGRDAVIYQRNVSDSRVNSCKLTGSDCKVPEVVRFVEKPEELASDQCNDKEECALRLRTTTNPMKTACNGEYIVVLSYTCRPVAAAASVWSTSGSQPNGRGSSGLVADVLGSVVLITTIAVFSD